jgi:hypothetical protein
MKDLIKRAKALSSIQQTMKVDGKFAMSSDPWIEHIYALMTEVHVRLFRIDRFQKEFASYPHECLRDELVFENVCMLELLVPRLEKWVSNESNSQLTVSNTMEFCKNRVLSGDLMNSIQTLDKLMRAVEYKCYCHVIRQLNDISRNK